MIRELFRKLVLTAAIGLLSLAALSAQGAVDPSTVLQMSFEDRLDDASANAMTFIERGTAAYANGVVGQALDLTQGGDNYVLVNKHSSFNDLSELYLSVNVKKGTLDASGDIIRKYGQYRLTIFESGVYASLTTDKGTARINVNYLHAVNDLLWHHYELIYDRREFVLKVDGVELGRKALTGKIVDFQAKADYYQGLYNEDNVGYDPDRENDYKRLYLGKDPLGLSFKGFIDDLVIKNRIPGLDNVVLKMGFEDNSDDESLNHHNARWLKGGGEFVEGVYGSALKLTSTGGNAVVVPNHPSLEGQEQLQFSIRAKRDSLGKPMVLASKEGSFEFFCSPSWLMARIKVMRGANVVTREIGAAIPAELYDLEWHQYTLTYDGRALRLSIDGRELSSSPVSGVMAASCTDLYIGHGPLRGTMDGAIDELLILNRLPVEDDTILRMDFDNNRFDQSGNGRSVFWGGNSQYRPGLMDSAAYLPGGGVNYLVAPHHESYGGMHALFINTVVKRDSAAGGGVILSKEGYYGLSLYGDSLTAYLTTEGGTANLTAPNSSADWQNIMLAYDGQRAALFVNGELVAQQPLSGVVVSRARSRDLLIGTVFGGTVPGFGGLIDSLEIKTDTDKEIIEFSLPAANNPSLTSDVKGRLVGDEILLIVPDLTDVTALTPVYSMKGMTVTVDGLYDLSGSSSHDFTSPLTYRVMAVDQRFKEYTVRVIHEGDELIQVPDRQLAEYFSGGIYSPGKGLTRRRLEEFYSLDMFGSNYHPYSEYIVDLEGIQHCKKLSYITFYYSLINDLTPISRLKELSSISLNESQLADLTPLKEVVGLTSIDISESRIVDLTPLTALGGLENIYLYSNLIEDLTPVKELINLRTLDVSRNKISDITPVQGLHNLRHLDIGHNNISDITPVASLSKLTMFLFQFNQVSDLTPVSHHIQLDYLYFMGNKVSDLSPIANLVNLTTLVLSDNLITDLTPITMLTKVDYLSIGYNRIGSLGPLSGMKELKNLSFGSTDVTDLSPLSGLVKLESIYFSYNKVTDLSPLSALNRVKTLYFPNNLVSDISPLQNLPALYSVSLDNNPLDSAAAGHINRLKARGVYVYE